MTKAGSMLSDVIAFAGKLPSPLVGGVAGALIGLLLGLCFPEKFARALGEFISAL